MKQSIASKLKQIYQQKRDDLPVVILFLCLSAIMAIAGVTAYQQYISSPPYIDPLRYPVKGIDISRHNGNVDLQAAAADGVRFVFIKASEGVTFRDRNFASNYLKATHAGLKIGAYHYFRFDRDGIAQAKNFLNAIGGRHLHLGIVIDVEDHGNATGVPADTILDRLDRMVEYLQLKGHRVMFYTNRDGYEKYLMERYPGSPLWICHFSQTPFDADWSFWQYDHHGTVKGIRGDVDLNVFVGSESDWDSEETQYNI